MVEWWSRGKSASALADISRSFAACYFCYLLRNAQGDHHLNLKNLPLLSIQFNSELWNDLIDLPYDVIKIVGEFDYTINWKKTESRLELSHVICIRLN